jgi:hypothetical protein
MGSVSRLSAGSSLPKHHFEVAWRARSCAPALNPRATHDDAAVRHPSTHWFMPFARQHDVYGVLAETWLWRLSSG